MFVRESSRRRYYSTFDLPIRRGYMPRIRTKRALSRKAFAAERARSP